MTLPQKSRTPLWKLRLTWSLDDLIAALETGSTEALKALDDSWDSCQRRLFHNVGAASEDEDPKIRLAAARVAAALLQGNGLAQTTLPYDEEVDVGRKQVALANSEGLSGDIALLKLEARVEQIDATTEKLADALGRSGGKKRGARSGRVREAMASCAVAFNGVHDDLAWLIDHLPEGKERQGLQALLTPLESLLTRYPATAAAAPEPPAPAEPAPEKKPG
jgi:hypothetical protein